MDGARLPRTLLCPALPAQVSLYSAVDLALRNSAAVRIATADMEKAVAILSQSRDVYVPSAYLGSGIGYSYGFPVGQPSIFNMTSQSLLVSFSQPDYIRAARSGLKATQLALKDVRQQVVLDTSLNYIQLSKTTREIAALDEESTYADRLLAIEQQRLDAGVEPRIEITKARLTAARIHLKRLHLESDAAVLRKLSHISPACLPQPSSPTRKAFRIRRNSAASAISIYSWPTSTPVCSQPTPAQNPGCIHPSAIPVRFFVRK